MRAWEGNGTSPRIEGTRDKLGERQPGGQRIQSVRGHWAGEERQEISSKEERQVGEGWEVAPVARWWWSVQEFPLYPNGR